MKSKAAVRLLFVIAAIYDGVLGLAFLIAPARIYEWFDVTPPNHWGYVQFPAALLIIFALMFLAIVICPIRNRNLIPYGILLKISYCAITLYYWCTINIPSMWKPFTIADLVFLVLFIWAYFAICSIKKNEAKAAQISVG